MNGAERIDAERQRQVTAEEWSPEHDAQHARKELARAAACYLAIHEHDAQLRWSTPPGFGFAQWPWDKKWWKPSDDPIRNLEKAGALIAAEIDRLLAERTS